MFKRVRAIAIILALWSGLTALPLEAPFAVHADEPAQSEAVKDRTVTFAIENMSCALCPVTVKKAMADVPGVSNVEVSLETNTATVVFDASTVSASDVAAASTNAGYPAEPVARDRK
jgi:mercuric ion binding protein